jgi:hypothetical protein
MTDRTTKLLLGLIALGLWANVTVTLFQPKAVAAQDRTLSSIDDHLSNIQSDLHKTWRNVDDIGDGTCTNGTICK